MSGTILGHDSNGIAREILINADGSLALGTAAGNAPILGAGEAHLGSVGGACGKAAVNFTRPSNTTPYTAFDVVGPAQLVVSGAANASPIVMTTGTHGLVDADVVTQATVGGNTNANGTFYVKVVDTTHYSLYSDKALTVPVAGNSNYTSGGTVDKLLRFTNMARVAGGSGYIVRANAMTNVTTPLVTFRLHVFTAPVPAIADNSPYTLLMANRASRVGSILFPACATEGSGSDAQRTLATPNVSSCNLPIKFKCQAGDTDLYGMLGDASGVTPASAQLYFVEMLTEPD